MEVEHILKLIQAVSESELTEFCYAEGDVVLELGKKEKEVVVKEASTVLQPSPAQPNCQPQMQVSADETAAAVTSAKQPEESQKEEETALEGNEIKSPLVGTFYSAPSPEEPAFVKVGDTVKKGQTLGIVEAMKLMNEIESDYDGVVKAVLIGNEEIVEYGQPLFVIE